MKKVVSLLLAVMLTATFSIGVFAAEDIPGDADGTLRDEFNALYDEVTVYDAEMDNDDYDTTASAYGAAGRADFGTGPNTYRVSVGEIVLVEGSGTNKTIVAPETHLEPGTEYTYNFYVIIDTPEWDAPTVQDPTATESNLTGIPYNTPVDDEWCVPIRHSMLGDNGRLKLKTPKGTGVISSAKIEKKGSGDNATYNLVLTTRDNYGTKITDTSYVLGITGTNVPGYSETTGGTTEYTPFVEGTAAFRVGYETVDDDYIDGYGEDDTITVYLDAPVYTKKQLDRIAKNFNYKPVEFEAEDSEWYYTGRVSGMSDTNFVWTHDVIPSIINKLDDYDLKFLTFNAGVTFPTNGEMRIDVSDVSGDWDRIYTYLYRNGSLTAINTSYDAGADEIIFRTNYLGAFVMSDREITDLSIIDTGSTGNESSSTDEGSTGNTGGGTGTDNPNMGLPSMNLVFGLGAVSLLTAGTVIIRKKK